jgi:hypothetical protein
MREITPGGRSDTRQSSTQARRRTVLAAVAPRRLIPRPSPASRAPDPAPPTPPHPRSRRTPAPAPHRGKPPDPNAPHLVFSLPSRLSRRQPPRRVARRSGQGLRSNRRRRRRPQGGVLDATEHDATIGRPSERRTQSLGRSPDPPASFTAVVQLPRSWGQSASPPSEAAPVRGPSVDADASSGIGT